GRVLVAAGELVGDREGVVDLVDAGRERALVPALVEDEARIDRALAPVDRGHDLLGARHLRHALWIDEAHRLDARHACGREAVAQLRPDGGGEGRVLVLEPVAGPDVADDQVHARASCRQRSGPGKLHATWRPDPLIPAIGVWLGMQSG